MEMQSRIENEIKKGMSIAGTPSNSIPEKRVGRLYNCGTIISYIARVFKNASVISDLARSDERKIFEEWTQRFADDVIYDLQRLGVIDGYLDQERVIGVLAVSAACEGMAAAVKEIYGAEKTELERKLSKISREAWRIVLNNIPSCERGGVTAIHNSFLTHFFLALWNIES